MALLGITGDGGTLGNTALALRDDADMVRRRETDLAEILDHADAKLILSRQHVDLYSGRTGGDRELVFAKREWLMAVWAEREREVARGTKKTQALEHAVATVAALKPDCGRELRTAGQQGKDARSVRNAKAWIKKLGMKDGKPDWSKSGALVKNYKGRPGTDADPEFLRAVMRLYLDPRQLPIAGCVRKVERIWRAEGREAFIPTYAQVQNYIRTRITDQLIIKYRDGRNAYANQARGYIPREINVEAGEAWFADHRIMDFWVRMPHPDSPDEWIAVRPYITAVRDAASGYIVAALIYADQYPNHERIIEVIQEAIRRNGNVPPSVWYTDQGKDFLKIGFVEDAVLRTHKGTLLAGPDGEPYRHSIIRALRTSHKPARGYNGKEKPVERDFGDVAGDFDRTQPGYCGNSPSTRPDMRDTWQGDVSRLPTEGQVVQAFEAWLQDEHHAREREDGQSRGQMWEDRPRHPERALDDRQLLMSLLLPQPQARLVGRTAAGTGGVKVEGWTYSHVEMRRWRGKHVMVKTYWGTPRVLRKKKSVPAAVFVFAPDDTFICLAIADGTADMFASTPEAKARLGELSHLVNAVARLDTDEFEEHTGRRTLGGHAQVMQMLPGYGRLPQGDEPEPATRLGSRRENRRLAAPRDPMPTGSDTDPEPSEADIAAIHEAINRHARQVAGNNGREDPRRIAFPTFRAQEEDDASTGFMASLLRAKNREEDPDDY